MGRIEEALKRAAAGRDAPEPPETPAPDPAGAETTDTPFVSAWQEEGSAAAAYARGVPTAGRPERRPAASSSLQLDSQIAMGWQPFDLSEDGKLVIMPQVDPAAMDGYARLAASLRESRAGRGVIAISSSVAGEGRTLTAINLALSLGRPDSRVLLIDADLRNARIHQIFQVSATSGLHDCLRADDPIAMPVIGLTSGVTLLPAGLAGGTPVALDSDRMRQLLAGAAQEYDWVILDTAPVLPAQPANLPAGMVGAVVFVVHAARTPRKVVKQALSLIDRDRVIGTLLNRGRA